MANQPTMQIQPWSFFEAIVKMNETFQSPNMPKPFAVPMRPDCYRFKRFRDILQKEVDEGSEAQEAVFVARHEDSNDMDLDALVAIADWLGDIIVYCASEADKYGIPMLPVLYIIMQSQNSKLVDGKPLFDETGQKFLKGPDYRPPEPALRELLAQLRGEPRAD